MILLFPTLFKSLESGSKNFVFTDEGSLSSYLGVSMDRRQVIRWYHTGFSMSQPFLLDRIIKAVGFNSETTKSVRDGAPAVYPLLNKDCDGHLQGTSRPDIAMVTHQCAGFCSNPELSHERAVKRIVTVCLGSTNIFFYFHFYAWFGMLLKGVGKNFILSEDEPLTSNIDGVMAL